VPGFTRIRGAADAYIDALWAEGNLAPKTIKDKRTEIDCWIGWCGKQHVEELDRSDLIAFRERLRSEGLAEWTVKTKMTTVVTMLKYNPKKQVTGLLKHEDWPEIEDTEPQPYEVEEVKALQSVAVCDRDSRPAGLYDVDPLPLIALGDYRGASLKSFASKAPENCGPLGSRNYIEQRRRDVFIAGHVSDTGLAR
jgi:hypothetical protein